MRGAVGFIGMLGFVIFIIWTVYSLIKRDYKIGFQLVGLLFSLAFFFTSVYIMKPRNNSNISLQNEETNITGVPADTFIQPVAINNENQSKEAIGQNTDNTSQPVGESKPVNNQTTPKVNNKGTDLSKDPKYIEELKKIYTEEQLKMMSAPMRIVKMPNLIGMTEAEAVKTMKALGVVARISYQDGGKEEGKCYAQEVPAGQDIYTIAPYFVTIQRAAPKVPVPETKPTGPVNPPVTP